MALLLLLVFGGVLLWLKSYTNHGQKLEVSNYVGTHYKEATKDAKKQSFELIVKDSVHRVGQPGGIIVAQNPKGGALVKENRKLYVDVTKYEADEYDISELPTMYGVDYRGVSTTLGHLNINTEITGYRHDPGTPDYVLDVRYEGQLIEGQSGRKTGAKIKKGGTLEFVLTKLDGAAVPLPDLICKKYGEVNFLLKMHKLALGGLEQQGAITDRDQAYVIAQNPPFSEGSTIIQGQTVEITIQQEEPESCK